MIRSAILGLALLATPLSAAPLQNGYNMQLLKLSSLQQRAVLRRAILDDGNACGRGTVVAWRGPIRCCLVLPVSPWPPRKPAA